MLYVPLDLEKGLTIDAGIDSIAFVSANAIKYLERIKQQAPANICKNDGPPIFQDQVAIGQLEKSLATTTLELEILETISCFWRPYFS